ncbi:WbqC family protein [Flavitalea flava]
MNLIIDLQYFPSIILYKGLNKFSNLVFEQYEHHQKMSFRNRCQVAGAEGLINLSIPLVQGRDQRTLIRDVKIAGSLPWQGQHWKTIVSCYNRSPWFEYYRDELEELYRKPFTFLVDWNIACWEWSLKSLRMPLPFSLTDTWQENFDPENWTDLRGKILPKNRIGWNSSIRYRQVFEERIGFLPNLSILDLLFCEGKRAPIFLIQG